MNIMNTKRGDAVLIYRPKRRRRQQGTQASPDLRELHRTLLSRNPPTRYQNQDQSSNSIQTKLLQRSGEGAVVDGLKDPPSQSINLFINIEKIKNLQITQRKPAAEETDKVTRPFHYRKSSLYPADRRAAVISRYSINKSQSRLQTDQSRSANKGSLKTILSVQKPKQRYRTSTEQSQLKPQNRSQQLINRRTASRNSSVAADRSFIEGYLRGRSLGRGGFSKVWQCFHVTSKKFFAIKQIDTTNKYQTHLTQIWFGSYFFDRGRPLPEYVAHPGIKHLLALHDFAIIEPSAYLVFETCDGSLGNMLYDIYEEEDADDTEAVSEEDRPYLMREKPLYNEMRRSPRLLKQIIYEVAQALDLLASQRIVHSDIKTENILLKKVDNDSRGVKVITHQVKQQQGRSYSLSQMASNLNSGGGAIAMRGHYGRGQPSNSLNRNYQRDESSQRGRQNSNYIHNNQPSSHYASISNLQSVASSGYTFKLIDYGSSFQFQSLKQYKLATPQYMCPQLLNYILYENHKPHRPELLPFVQNGYDNISAIDVWGLGAVVLQLVMGVPLWMTNPTEVEGYPGKRRGLFAVGDRAFGKILDKQIQIVAELEAFLRRQEDETELYV